MCRRDGAGQPSLLQIVYCVAFFTLNCFTSVSEETGGQGLERGNDLEMLGRVRSVLIFDVEASIRSVLSVHVSLSGPLALLT